MEDRESFEGHDVTSVEGVARGSVGDARLNAVLAPDDRVVLVCTAVVKRIEHVSDDGGVTRKQHLKITEGFVLQDEVDGDDLIHGLRSERKKALDDLLGTPPLEGFDGDE